MGEAENIVAKFSVSYKQHLNEHGQLDKHHVVETPDQEWVEHVYRTMVKTRLFDKKAISLQRTGKLGTYPSTLGQEAICVGLGAAMRKEDVLCPYYREYGAQFLRGVTMEEILLYWGGDEKGSCFEHNQQDFPICVPIASQTLHAAGVAFAIQYKKQDNVVVTTVGDGGTSRGDFYEALNVSGIWKLPVVFVINSNQWAISVPRSKQTASETLAQKGWACGVPGVQIDGNDVICVYDTVNQAIKQARSGGGPTVIEALSYRMCDHTTADDASRYRPNSEIKAHEKYDPITRVKQYMIAAGIWNEDKEHTMIQTLSQEVNQAVENYLNAPTPPPEILFEHLYASLPKAYQAQREALKQGVT